jgi:hypothetical protein
MKKIELTDAQLDYLKNCVDDSIEEAQATISCSDSKIDRQQAKAELKFFEDFKMQIEKALT